MVSRASGSRSAWFSIAAVVLYLTLVPSASALETVYWGTNSGTIEFASLTSGAVGTLSTSGATIGEISGLAVDHSRGKIYRADYEEATISYASLDGSGGGGVLPVTSGYVGEPIRPAILDPSVRAKPPAKPAPPPGPVPVATVGSCLVPALRGRGLRSAKRRIRESGCAVGKVRRAKASRAKLGKVVAQQPKPGAVVAAGATVRVVLGRP